MPKAKIIKSEKLFSGRIVELLRDQVIEPGGKTGTREVVRHPGAVVIVPVLNDSTLILIRQYRYAVDEFLWELPAGSLEKSENPLEAAYREVEEETGYRAESMQPLAEFFSTPGFTDERMHLFLATQLSKTAMRLEEDETIEAHPLSIQEALSMIFRGQIKDAKSIVGLLLAKEKLNWNRTR